MSNALPDGHCIVFVVKYWQTQGIYRLRGTVSPKGYFHQETPSREDAARGVVAISLSPSEYERDAETARATVEKKRQAAMLSLRKKLSKLEALAPQRMVIPLLKGDKGAKADAR